METGMLRLRIITIVATLIAVVLISVLVNAYVNNGFHCKYANQNSKSTCSFTSLRVTNKSTDTVTVYLTLNNADTNWITNVNGIFGIQSKNLLQGSFKLAPKQVKTYTSKKAIAGNVSFGQAPLNCPFPAPTLYEFCLNNAGTVSDAQETADISCVYGVTTIGSIEFRGGGVWNSGINDSVTKIQNRTLYKNTNLKGVFPYGCTTCVGREGMVDCSNKQKYENTSKRNLCQIQRDATKSGGSITITYIKQLP